MTCIAQGLEAVGACIDTAIATHQAEQAAQAPQSPKLGTATNRTQREPRVDDGGHGDPLTMAGPSIRSPSTIRACGMLGC